MGVVKRAFSTSFRTWVFDLEARATKLGPAEITRDIPNIGEDMLKDLDEEGVIRIGAEVRPEDILVGKVAPKGQGGPLVADGHLRRGGKWPLHTDRGVLSSCHQGVRGIFLLLAAVRQLRGHRGEAQVPARHGGRRARSGRRLPRSPLRVWGRWH